MKILRATYKFLICILSLLLPFNAHSQITSYPIQDFNFGTYFQGSTGGTISISTEGFRSSTGDIVLLNSGPSVSQAIYEIEAPVNTMISVLSTTATLSNGMGGTMILEITGSSPVSFFKHTAISPDRSTIRFSGKLIVGDKHTSPPGIYRGTVSITFNQE